LILADKIEPLPTSQVGSGPFVIGGSRVRPNVNRTFTRDQTLGIYMQVYNLAVDPQTHRPSAEVQYEIAKEGKSVLTQAEQVAKMQNAAQQITLQKKMPLNSLQPGKYSVQIKVTDNVKNQTITQTDTFEVR
ncbi:MAG: GWxTD domain-containing protein, partial [Acidobacteria bacterium]